MQLQLLRFHGHRYDVASTEVQQWTQLYTDLLPLTENNTYEAWVGVCVALIRHPDFYSY